ncbi:sugar ABC transporter ATP-binding protein [Rhodophyticola sp. CCM32]|uniref:sugar ABC transporter ATP-binding protein n=1 Tax=Rhodophyticola sp. CCM32 TaxID=2916397 RepID=UPI00107F71B0|nr:sugar ABC transporter ATP-binding protein [Rhodophyticola sp. CCM32]QBY00062.1 sugar ABC transporter ATP-binding protein [Rhodophyticola sp. CCM32]
MTQPLLAARGLSKSFGPNEVLKNLDFDVNSGACVALCGENGAGKSTLIKLLTGLYQPTAGHVEYLGAPVAWAGPRASLEAGIAVVHQEFSTLGALSVAENIFLGSEPRTRFGLIDRRRLNAQTQGLFDALGIALSPRILVDTLSVADKQMVEIAKALRSDARILILDEPTAVLSQNETRHLFKLIAELRAKGMGIVYVSHRLDEIFEICTDITVIKDGVVTSKGPISDFNHDSVVSAMVGRDLGDMFPAKPDLQSNADRVLTVEDFVVQPGGPSVSFHVDAGEIVGLGGLVGSGRTELALALYGAEPATGHVEVMGEPLPYRSPASAIEAGILMLTESRKDDGLFAASSVARNFTATTPGLGAHHARIPRGHEEARAGAMKSRFGVVVDHVGLPISALSGGNQQKVLVARLLENRPKVLILDEPTRGVDVGAKAEIYRILRRLAEEGVAILVISSELIEIVGLCDRVYVMRDGELASELTGAEITEEAIISIAAIETATHHGVRADA